MDTLAVWHAVWYALQAPPMTEFRVARALRALGYECLVPSEMERQRTSQAAGRRQYKRRRPLFPGYVFAGILGAADWSLMRELRIPDKADDGADKRGGKCVSVRPVRFGGAPAVLTDAEVEHLRIVKTRAQAVIGLSAGCLVRIIDGPLSLAHTKALRVASVSESSAEIELPMFGAPRIVSVPLVQIAAA